MRLLNAKAARKKARTRGKRRAEEPGTGPDIEGSARVLNPSVAKIIAALGRLELKCMPLFVFDGATAQEPFSRWELQKFESMGAVVETLGLESDEYVVTVRAQLSGEFVTNISFDTVRLGQPGAKTEARLVVCSAARHWGPRSSARSASERRRH